MTLLDRFRPQPRQKHPDPAVRLAYVAELPLSERDLIVAAAREDEDVRVRRAAVAKLLDPSVLAAIARDDADTSVRDEALTMLRDKSTATFVRWCAFLDEALKSPARTVRIPSLGMATMRSVA